MAVMPPSKPGSLSLEQWVEILQRAPLPVLDKEEARLKQLGTFGANEVELFSGLREARVMTEIEEAAAQDGAENFLRHTARKVESGELPEDFVKKVLFPVYVEKARESYRGWGGEEVAATFSAIPEVAGDLASGLYAAGKYAAPAAMGALKEGLGLENVLGDATLEQKQAKELFGASVEQGTRETARLAQRLWRIDSLEANLTFSQSTPLAADRLAWLNREADTLLDPITTSQQRKVA
jgi:hypothetical protein